MKVNKIHFLFLLIGIAIILSLYFALFVPVLHMQPIYYEIAIDIQNNNFVETFWDFGYSALISGYIMNDVEITMKVVHFLSLVLTWIITLYFFLNINLRNKIKGYKFYDINFVWIFFWFTFLFFHPYFHLNLTRYTSTGIVTLFFTALYVLILLKFKFSKILLTVGGILFGILIAIRPNAIILILFFLIFFNKVFISKYQTTILFISSLLAYIIFSKFFTGNFLYWPTNGPNNLLLGNNPFTYEALKIYYTSDVSITKAFEWCGTKNKDPFLISSTDAIYCTLKFVQNDFFGFVNTTIFKIYNLLFRPNLNLAFELYEVIIQILIVIPAYIWWLLFLFNSNFRKEFSVKWGALFIIIYSSIFIGTNSDPRYGLPFVIIYIISSMNFVFNNKKS